MVVAAVMPLEAAVGTLAKNGYSHFWSGYPPNSNSGVAAGVSLPLISGTMTVARC